MSGSLGLPACKLNLSKRGLFSVNESYIQSQATAECGSWAAVTALDLSSNKMAGNLSMLPNMSRLQELNLYGNKLTGTLEPLVGAMVLHTLHLGVNKFSGTLWPLSKATKLTSLRLYVNDLHGTLEPLRQAVNLKLLYIGYNNLTGSLDPIAGAKKLAHINLVRNRLVGTLQALRGMQKLRMVYLEANMLSGTLQPFSESTALEDVNLGGNMLWGTVSPLANSRHLRKLLLDRNTLSGTLDDLRASPLLYLDASSNKLFKGMLSFSVSLPNAAWVNMSRNNIHGRLAELTLHGKAAVFDISSNHIVCPYPGRMQSRTLLSFHDPCHGERDFMVVAAVAGGIMLAASLSYLAYCRWSRLRHFWSWAMSRTSTQVACLAFLGMQANQWLDLSADGCMLWTIFKYCLSPLAACSVINDPKVFVLLMPMTFTNWTEQATVSSLRDYTRVALATGPGRLYKHLIPINMGAVMNFCNGLAHCEFSQDDQECQTADENQHGRLIKIAAGFTVVYVAKELLKVSCVLRVALSGGVGPRWLGLCQTSAACPLILLLGGRAKLASVIFHARTASDALVGLVLDGVLEIMPQLFLNFYFALAVTTQGLDIWELFSICINLTSLTILLIRSFSFFTGSAAPRIFFSSVVPDPSEPAKNSEVSSQRWAAAVNPSRPSSKVTPLGPSSSQASTMDGITLSATRSLGSFEALQASGVGDTNALPALPHESVGQTGKTKSMRHQEQPSAIAEENNSSVTSMHASTSTAALADTLMAPQEQSSTIVIENGNSVTSMWHASSASVGTSSEAGSTTAPGEVVPLADTSMALQRRAQQQLTVSLEQHIL